MILPSYLPCGRRAILLAIPLLILLMSAPPSRPESEVGGGPKLELRPGDRISILGNALAYFQQHDGWLETYFHSRFPEHEFVFRNLGFAADELTVRLRSARFGSPDEWLTKTKTDVIFAFFGYNESFAGEAGLPKFRGDLDAFVKKTVGQKYNGKDSPRLVLFSPIAHENLRDPNLPDGTENNRRLELYTNAMAEVARGNGAVFVDLFHPSQKLFASTKQPLTRNGIHLNESGNEALAKVIDQALFPAGPEPKRTAAQLEKIRQAVLERNFYWFNRYRTVDGYSIYGERANLKFVAGQTNRVVMQREMEILDAMADNRDRRIWAVARGGDLKVADDNLPPFLPVKTNKPGKQPEGKHLFLDGEESIKSMTTAPGMKVNLFASEKEFPDLVNPVQMAFDPRGRLWVAVWPTYPHWKPGQPMNDKLLILEDADGDGKADKCTTFVGDLHCPTGFEFYNGGVLVAQAPDLVFLEDTNGDDKADVRTRVLSGLDSADTHHTSNSFILDPGGALYFQEGTFHHTQVETPYGPPVRNANAGVLRYEPRAQRFEVYVNFGFANPHGHVFDRWGQDFVIDGTGSEPYHGTLFSGQTADYKQRHARPPMVYRPKTRPCPGMEILSSRHFPEANQGNLLVGNVIGFLGILQYKFADKGSSFTAIEVEPIVFSKDPNFRPSDIKMGPDGAIYFSDWHNPVIGHMQHNLRDPVRDSEHGRVYRVTYPSRPLLKPTKIAGESIEKLLEVLQQPEDRVRYRARIELGSRDTKQVLAALEKWTAKLDKSGPEYEHQMLEALWIYQNHNIVNEDLLHRTLRSPDYRARAAATRVLCAWRGRVQAPLDLLRAQINDAHPRVRLEAIRAVSFFHDEMALAIALELLSHPDDPYLRYTFNETLNTLERRLVAGSKLNRKNIASSLLQLLEKETFAPASRPVLLETVCRHGGAKELSAVWQQALRTDGYPPELRRDVLEWLAEAAVERRVQPTVGAGTVQRFLEEAARDAALLPKAIRLASAWKAKETAGELRQIASASKTSLEARHAAIDALAIFADAESQKALRDLTAATQALPVRFRAAVALARLDASAGAKAAAAALATTGESDDPGPVVEAFLTRKGGGEQLAAALAKEKVTADAAKRILRAMFVAGLSDPRLNEVAGRFAGLDALPKAPTVEEARRFAAEVQEKGDPARGERIFRRADLGCLKCHAIGKAGGNVGPDLGPIGGSSPLDYIVAAILDPNQAIKEEYLTSIIGTSTGDLVTGIVVERNKNVVVLKDGTGTLVRIPAADIENEAKGKSLMPEGVTRILTHAETSDLIRFVSELGKSAPYTLRDTPTVRRWKLLRDVPAALREGTPNREALRETVLRSNPDAWETVYAQVSGTLPLNELRRPDRGTIVYLQGEVDVTQAGSIEVRVEAGGPVTFWVDEESFEKQAKGIIELPPGRHRITVRVALADARAPELRVELHRPAGSKVRFEIVQGD